jgi:hypothetical protein
VRFLRKTGASAQQRIDEFPGPVPIIASAPSVPRACRSLTGHHSPWPPSKSPRKRMKSCVRQALFPSKSTRHGTTGGSVPRSPPLPPGRQAHSTVLWRPRRARWSRGTRSLLGSCPYCASRVGRGSWPMPSSRIRVVAVVPHGHRGPTAPPE